MTRIKIMRILAIQFGAALLFAGFLAIPGLRRSEARSPSMDDWSVEDLVDHLREGGLEFRTIPAMTGGPMCSGVYLTTADKPDAKVRTLSATTERLSQWQGTVFCSLAGYSSDADTTRLWLWGDSYLRVGRFVFFGDPEMRAKIQDVLCGRGAGH